MAQLRQVDDAAPQPWRNGGGQTRELVAWPGVDEWRVRISIADIDTDGPFSTFEGVTRWMTVVAGDGVQLRFNDHEHRLAIGDPPVCFDGTEAPHCHLIGSATRDLNLMVRGGRSVMRVVEPHVAWDEGFAMRGVFTAEPGTWSDGATSRALPAMSLLWLNRVDGADVAWRFVYDEAQATTRAWWLGYDASATLDTWRR